MKSADWKWKRQSQESEAREEICNILIWASPLRNPAGGLTSDVFSICLLKANRQYLTDLDTHTLLHHRWAHEHLPEKLPINMQWLCTSPARCKWLQVLFCLSPSLKEKQQIKGITELQAKNYAGGPLYVFSVGKIFNKEGGNCQQKENLCEIGVEVTWRDQLCHVSDWRNDF